MAQLKKVVSVTNGSQSVSMAGDYTSQIKANYIFLVEGELVPYVLAGDSTFNTISGRTEFTLTGAYAGTTNSIANGVVVTDYTFPDLIPTIRQGDVGTGAVFTQAMYRIQELIGAVAPEGLQATLDAAAAVEQAAIEVEADRVAAEAAAQGVTDSAAAAEASATAAGLARDEAVQAADDVNTGVTASAQSASEAAASALTASNQAAIALTKAGEADASADAAAASEAAAAGSATTATTKAAEAAASATSAATSANALTAGLASFRSKWLGEHAADPTVDGNGDPLADGAEYFNTVENKHRVYSDGAWQDYDEAAQVATNSANAAAAAAAASAAAAATSESEAEAAAATATTKAGEADASATAAANSETAALISAAAAADDADTAGTHAATATTKAGEAAASAATAAGHATTATTKAGEASASAATAAGHETAAETARAAAELAETKAEAWAEQAEDVEVEAGQFSAKHWAIKAQEAADSAVAGGVSSVNGRSGAVVLDKTDVGLGDVENKSSATIRGELTAGNVTSALGYTPLDPAEKGAANGVASLDATGKVPANQLPSYVDDVVEAADFASLPGTGEAGKIYVTLDDGKQHRWSGSAYTTWESSPGTTDAVTEGATNLYHTSARVRDTVLAGMSTASEDTPTAADTVLSAFGKLVAKVTSIITALAGKQDTLVSGTSIKTVNGTTLLGAGDIEVTTAPPGADTQVPFNDGGTWATAAGFTYNKLSSLFSVPGAVVMPQAPSANGADGGGLYFGSYATNKQAIIGFNNSLYFRLDGGIAAMLAYSFNSGDMSVFWQMRGIAGGIAWDGANDTPNGNPNIGVFANASGIAEITNGYPTRRGGAFADLKLQNLTAAGGITAVTFTGALAGNASTATALATARNIDGVAFDGTANVAVIAPATAAATSKTTPVDADSLPLVDSADGNALKRLTWANLVDKVKTAVAQTAATFYTMGNAFTEKTSMVDGDVMVGVLPNGMVDTARKITFANFKASIKSYYDAVSSTLTNKTLGSGTTLGAELAGGGNTVSNVVLKNSATTSYDNGAGGAWNYANGSVQRFAPVGATIVSISNWPASGKFGAMFVKCVNLGAYTTTWPSNFNWVKPDGTTTTDVAVWLAAMTGRTQFQSSGVDFLKITGDEGGAGALYVTFAQ